MKAKATFRGHAIHAIMVTVPLGAVPVALVFDALYVWSASDTWLLAAAVATAVAALGIIAASIPGTIDFMSVVPREGEVWKRATSHLALGWVVGAYYVAFATGRFLVLTWDAAWLPWALLGANALGFGLLMLQGYWGGELVERHHIGVHERSADDGGSPTDARRRPRRSDRGLD